MDTGVAVVHNEFDPKEEFWWLGNASRQELCCRLVRTDLILRGGIEAPVLMYAWTGSTDKSQADWIPIRQFYDWGRECKGVNIHRSLVLMDRDTHTLKSHGPFLVDIDASEEQSDHSRVDGAKQLALQVIEWLTAKYSLEEGTDVRCFFSGFKGFHVEVRPDALCETADATVTQDALQTVDRDMLSALNEQVGRLFRRLALPEAIKRWSLTSVQTRLIKIGGRLVRHARRLTFQLAEVMVTQDMFGEMLERIGRLRFNPG